MMETKNKKILNKIAKKYGIRLLLFFGSRLKEKFLHKESDFDIAYLAKSNLDLMEEARLICDLMPIFKSENIDLVNLKKASSLLTYAILQNCQILYEESPLIFYFFRAYSFKKYIETKPLYQEKAKRLEKLIKNL